MFTIVNSVSWSDFVTDKQMDVGGRKVRVVSNAIVPGTDFVCDTGSPFQALSKKLAPEKRVYIPTEPSPILNMNQNLAKKISEYYKGAILAWHKPLQKFPQTVCFTNSLCWVHDGWSIDQKQFGISGFVSGKNRSDLKGYEIRRKVLSHEHSIKIPSMVWNFRGKWQGKPHTYPLKGKKNGMGYMFHFAIENCREEEYFTEKIMDCFRSYSVPLYWGDPAIFKKFDKDGIILLSPKNLLQQVNALTEEDYRKRLPAVKNNYQIAGKYLKGMERVILAIMEKRGMR